MVRGVNWLTDAARVGDTVGVRVRHRAPIVAGEIVRLDGTEVEIALQSAVAAITPGQSAVMYSGDVVLGGGFIARTVSAAT